MSTPLLRTGSVGVNVEIGDDGGHRERARALEELGYDALWIAGGQLDRLDRVTELVEATGGIGVATGIVPLGVYDVPAIAGLHAGLAASAPGRFVLGLGGPQQARPMAALDGYLTDLDERGVAHDQRLLAALGPRKLDVARERSAGAITLLTTPEATAAARDRLGPGPLLVVHQVLALERDGERARAAAYAMLGFLAQVPGYRTAWLRMGFAEGEIDDLAARFVDGVVAWGDEEQVAARLDAHRVAGADHLALSILPSEGGLGAVEVATRLAAALGPTLAV